MRDALSGFEQKGAHTVPLFARSDREITHAIWILLRRRSAAAFCRAAKALFPFLIFLADRRILRLVVACLDGVGFRHVLAVFRLAVPLVALFVKDFG